MDERTGIVYDIVDAKYGEVMSTNKAIDLTLIECDVVGHFKWYRIAIEEKIPSDQLVKQNWKNV